MQENQMKSKDNYITFFENTTGYLQKVYKV